MDKSVSPQNLGNMQSQQQIDPELQQELNKLEETVRQYQEESKYIEAIGVLEELLKRKKQIYGTNSRQFTKSCKQLCEICNILAVYYLKKEDINSALDLLKKSEELCENNELGQAMTFNNMACYYRRIGKMRTALNFLQRALTIESRLQRPETQADTHLNICAVLSQLNKHELALNHAMSAVILLQEMMLRKKLDPQSCIEDDLDEPGSAQKKDTNKDKVAVLAIAYHNMGVEQEFLRSYPAAILSYKKAVNFAEKNLGPDDGITQNLRSVYENAKNELDLALFKKKKGGAAGGKVKKGKRMGPQYENLMQDQYGNMITPRNDQMVQNMERVDEDQEENVEGHDESQQIAAEGGLAGPHPQMQQM